MVCTQKRSTPHCTHKVDTLHTQDTHTRAQPQLRRMFPLPLVALIRFINFETHNCRYTAQSPRDSLTLSTTPKYLLYNKHQQFSSFSLTQRPCQVYYIVQMIGWYQRVAYPLMRQIRNASPLKTRSVQKSSRSSSSHDSLSIYTKNLKLISCTIAIDYRSARAKHVSTYHKHMSYKMSHLNSV